MPTYEYMCNTCGKSFEKFQGINDEPLKKCPECGGSLKRLISGGAGLIFKGEGFYSTDYKRSSADFKTCCGRDTRCDNPPCSDSGDCQR